MTRYRLLRTLSGLGGLALGLTLLSQITGVLPPIY